MNNKFRSLELGSFYAMGISKRLNPDEDENFKEIKSMWEEFFKSNLYELIPNKADTDILSIYYDYESNYLAPYSFLIGARVSDIEKIPKGMEALIIPPSEIMLFLPQMAKMVILYVLHGKIYGSQVFQDRIHMILKYIQRIVLINM